MAYVPQKPLWVPDPTYLSFREWRAATLNKNAPSNIYDRPTRESLRARGQPNVYQYVDEGGRAHNPPATIYPIRDGPPGLRRTTTVPRFRCSPEEEKEVRLRGRRRRLDFLAHSLVSTTKSADEALASSERLASEVRALRWKLTMMSNRLSVLVHNYEGCHDDTDDKGYDQEIASVVCGPDCHRHSAGASSGASSSDGSAGSVDPWGPEGWGSDKGKEKEILQQEPDEELIMPTLCGKKGAENKEKESSPSEALSGSASREF